MTDETRCLCCNQTGVVIHIKDEPDMRGFPFCRMCLIDLDARNYDQLAERMLWSHEDMQYTIRNHRLWTGTYRDIGRLTNRQTISEDQGE